MRKPMITRNITSTKVTYLAMDLVELQPVQFEDTLPRTYKDDDAIVKALSKKHNSELLKVVSVISKSEQTELRGMSEDKFIENSVVLDEKRKPLETETEQETEN